MDRYTDKERAFCVEAYFRTSSYTTVIRQFRRDFKVPRHKSVPSWKSVNRWVQNFRETGKASDRKRPGPKRWARTPENIQRVREAIQISPTRSARRHAAGLRLKRESVSTSEDEKSNKNREDMDSTDEESPSMGDGAERRKVNKRSNRGKRSSSAVKKTVAKSSRPKKNSESGSNEEYDDSDSDADRKKPKKKKAKEPVETKSKKTLLNPVDTDIDSIDYDCERLTEDGKRFNFKIVSWNVAGIRAWVKKNGHKYMKKEFPDIMCLQEVKCAEDKLPPEVKVTGYHTYWSLGVKQGYAGVGLYTKQKPLHVTYGIGMPDIDSEGRVIIAEYDKFYLVCVYVPNAGAGLKNLKRRMEWDIKFRKKMKSFDEKKPVIIVGDMNVSHQPIDLANPKTNTKSAGFTQEERDGMTALLEEGFVDTFRYLYPDKIGAYTYWTYLGNARSRNTGWRLDYFIISQRYLKHLCDNIIRNKVYGSDHCPVVLYLCI